MLIMAEIFNNGDGKYWRHGVFALKNIMGTYYWRPFRQLINKTPEDFNISCSCILHKTNGEICQIKEEEEDSDSIISYGYKFEPGDLLEAE